MHNTRFVCPMLGPRSLSHCSPITHSQQYSKDPHSSVLQSTECCPLKMPATETVETSGRTTFRTQPKSPKNPPQPLDPVRESLREYIPIAPGLFWPQLRYVARDMESVLQSPSHEHNIQFHSFRIKSPQHFMKIEKINTLPSVRTFNGFL